MSERLDYYTVAPPAPDRTCGGSSRAHTANALYAETRALFSDKDLVDLTVAVIAINAWNRLAVTFRRAVGHYTPAAVTTRVPTSGASALLRRAPEDA